jgi:hypothetical protein
MNADERRFDDEFEARLARQPLRAAPPELRAQVLAAVQEKAVGASPCHPQRLPGETAHSSPGWLDWLLARFPIPAIGIAAVWAFVFFTADVDRRLNGNLAQAPVTVSREQIAEARAQRAELWQMAGLDELRPRLTSPAPTPAPPRPRSQVRPVRDDRFGGLSNPGTLMVADTSPRGIPDLRSEVSVCGFLAT